MARKSRKTEAVEAYKGTESCAVYQVGFYLRLSDRDIREGNSESIENQRGLLAEFIKNQPELRWRATFVDDGKTGTNFSRSGFEQMMEAVKKGIINCVMVKDLSRFGRNYLETGNYLEYVFPFLKVRFIAVTDEFDTLTADQTQMAYLIPLKNIMNENYARDISQKERSAKKMLRKKGCFLGAYAVYGYQKAENRHRICMDPEAARHVRKIFDLCEQGYSDSGIAKYLNGNQTACPARYKYEKGILKHEKYANTCGWYPQTIAGILTNRTYVGDLVQGVYISKEIRGKKKIMPREAWDVVEGTHEPIITREQFDRVQKIRLERYEKKRGLEADEEKKRKASYEENILKGKVYCGDCNKAMVRKHIGSCKDEYRYLCDVYERNGCCVRKYLPEGKLKHMLQCLIQKKIAVLYEKKNWPGGARQADNVMQDWELELKEAEQSLSRLAEERAGLYRDWKEGSLTLEGYFADRERSKKEAAVYRKRREELLGRKQESNAVTTRKAPVIPEILTKELADCFIERIEVYENGRVLVRFCFQEDFECGAPYVQK